jgi:hypothetical protein
VKPRSLLFERKVSISKFSPSITRLQGIVIIFVGQITHNGHAFMQALELEFLSSGTVAKFIIKAQDYSNDSLEFFFSRN